MHFLMLVASLCTFNHLIFLLLLLLHIWPAKVGELVGLCGIFFTFNSTLSNLNLTMASFNNHLIHLFYIYIYLLLDQVYIYIYIYLLSTSFQWGVQQTTRKRKSENPTIAWVKCCPPNFSKGN